MLEQMDVTESSWPGPGFMEPMFPVGAYSRTQPIDADGRGRAPLPSRRPRRRKRSRQEGAAEGTEEAGERRRRKRKRRRRNAAANSTGNDNRGSVSTRRSRATFRRKTCVCRASLALSIAVACSAPREKLGDPAQEIAALLQRSAADWNHGDLAGFMSDYARDSLTSYMSAVTSSMAAAAVRSLPGELLRAGKIARLRSHSMSCYVRVLTPDFAYATARFKLTRRDSVVASGPFTLVLQRQGDRCASLHDHTSPAIRSEP